MKLGNKLSTLIDEKQFKFKKKLGEYMIVDEKISKRDTWYHIKRIWK
jgi:hypothetical protein